MPLPGAVEWWRSLRPLFFVITFLIAIALAGSFVSYERVLNMGHPWLPKQSCPGCFLCGMTRSFCAMSAGDWRAAAVWNRGGPALYAVFWLWLLGGCVYTTLVMRKIIRSSQGGRERARTFCWILILMSALTAGSCNQHPPDWQKVLGPRSTASPATPAPTPETTNELVVYLDTSASMAGYVSRDGQSIFGKVLRELRYSTATFDQSDLKVLVRKVAADVGPTLSDMELTVASQDQSVYRGGETNLAGAISSFRAGLSGAAAKPPGAMALATSASNAGAEVVAVPKFHVLVTDGVQSTKQGSATHDCTAGSDQFCVRQKIGELMSHNWGGCVLGIRADFSGKVYSEVSKSGIPYETRANDAASFRPFYLYIFSPDPSALDSLVDLLKKRLRPLLPKPELLRELNLSFPYTNGPADFEVLVDKNAKDFIKSHKDRTGPPSHLTIKLDVDTETSGAKPFAFVAKLPWSAHAVDTATAEELAGLLDWTVQPIYPAENEAGSKRFPEIRILGTNAAGPEGVVIAATAGFPRGTEKPSWRGYHLTARLNLNKAVPSWIKEWSVDLDNTREAGNRTFNLETALQGLWGTLKTQDQVVAEAFIRIGPK